MSLSNSVTRVCLAAVTGSGGGGVFVDVFEKAVFAAAHFLFEPGAYASWSLGVEAWVAWSCGCGVWLSGLISTVVFVSRVAHSDDSSGE